MGEWVSKVVDANSTKTWMNPEYVPVHVFRRCDSESHRSDSGPYFAGVLDQTFDSRVEVVKCL